MAKLAHVAIVVVALSLIGCRKELPKDPMDRLGGARLTFALDQRALDGPALVNLDRTRNLAASSVAEYFRAAGHSYTRTKPVAIDRFEVDIPGARDLAELSVPSGSAAKIGLYHARNLVTEKYTNRRYQDVPASQSEPGVYFVDLGTGKRIRAETPEYAAIIESWGDPILSGPDIESASTLPQGQSYIPSVRFSSSGATKMTAWSRKYYNTGEKLAWVLDGKVLNVAPLAYGARITDAAIISGSFDAQYVSKIRNAINAGRWPQALVKVSEEVVKPKSE